MKNPPLITTDKPETGLELLGLSTIQTLESIKHRASGSDPGSPLEASSILEECRRSPARFRANLIRDLGLRTEVIGEKLDPWQRRDFEQTDAMWAYAARVSNYKPVRRRAYLERPRGHSKTSDIALMVTWAILAAPVRITGIAAAASEEQAALLIGAAEGLILSNPWLASVLEVQSGKIINTLTGSTCLAVAAKSNVRYGATPDFSVADELTHWDSKSGKRVWTALFSGLHKVPTSTMVVITNAGESKGRSWQWRVRERCRQDPGWYFSSLDGSVASWLSPSDLEEQKRGLDDTDYRRLILNQWTSNERAGISAKELQAATVLAGPARDKFHGCDAIIGAMDVGIKHDRTSFVCIGINTKEKRLELLSHHTWRPDEFHDGRVNLAVVEETILEDHRKLGGIRHLYADDHQAIRSLELLGEKFPCSEVPFVTAIVRKELAAQFADAFSSGWIRLFHNDDLARDLQAVTIERNEVTRDKTLKADRDEHGHADSAFALAIGILYGQLWLKALTEEDVSTETTYEGVSI